MSFFYEFSESTQRGLIFSCRDMRIIRARVCATEKKGESLETLSPQLLRAVNSYVGVALGSLGQGGRIRGLRRQLLYSERPKSCSPAQRRPSLEKSPKHIWVKHHAARKRATPWSSKSLTTMLSGPSLKFRALGGSELNKRST